MGIYIGFFMAFLIALRSREYLREHFQIKWMFFLFAPILYDGGTQLLGLRESTNVLRLLTGLFGGVAMAWLTALILGKVLVNFKKFKEEEGAFPSRRTGIISVSSAFIAFLAVLPLTNNLLLTGGTLLYWALTAMSLASLVIIQGVILLMMVEFFFRPNKALEKKIREIEERGK